MSSEFAPFKRAPANDLELFQPRHLTPTSLPKNANCPDFSHYVTHNGVNKVFWYVPMCVIEGFPLFSEWFESSRGNYYRLLFHPEPKTTSFGIFIEMKNTDSDSAYAQSSSVTIEMFYKSNEEYWVSRLHFESLFSYSQRDWGFECLLDYSIVHSVFFEVTILEESSALNSKELTGYVGLKNLGATCYLNSFLQILFNLPRFRTALSNCHRATGLSGSLNQVLKNLSTKRVSVNPKLLLNSLKTPDSNILAQQDVQEFSIKFFEQLSIELQDNVARDCLELFQGTLKSCTFNTETSEETEETNTFYDLQLTITNCSNVQESLDLLLKQETVDNVIKRLFVWKLPPVLQLQLKRFEWDFTLQSPSKLNVNYTFPEQLVLSESCESSASHRYDLFSVIVHTGTPEGGHYHALINPQLRGHWLKFDDSEVSPMSRSQVLCSGAGGSERHLCVEVSSVGLCGRVMSLPSSTNAYILIYTRSSLQEVLFSI